MSQVTPDHLDALIEQKNLGRVYLFDGPELWLKEEKVAKIIASLLPKESLDLNFHRYHADSLSGSDVISNACSLPFLGNRRVIVVHEAEDMASSDQKIIAEGMGRLPDTTCLIFLYQGKASLKDEIVAQAASHGNIITFWTPFDNQLPAWVTQEVKKRGKNIAWAAAQELAESCSNLQELAHEVERLILYVGKKTTISLDDVMGVGLLDEVGDYRDLENAIWRRDLASCLKQSRLLSEVGMRAESIFPVFERIFRTLIMGHHLKSKKNMQFEDICSQLRINGKMRRELFQAGLRLYTGADLISGLSKIVNADYDNKTGGLPGDMALTLMIMGTLRREKTLAFR